MLHKNRHLFTYHHVNIIHYLWCTRITIYLIFANYISKKIGVTGVLEFDYKGRLIRIDYGYAEYGGTPHRGITDKTGYHHPFRKVFGVWRSALTVEPKWPRDFIESLYMLFERVPADHKGIMEGVG